MSPDKYISILDLALIPFVIAGIAFISYFVNINNINQKRWYRYYIPGLLAKLVGATAFAVIYSKYYQGGDTFAYYEGACVLTNLLQKDLGDFMRVYFSSASEENYSLFNGQIGYIWPYLYFDIRTLTVIRLVAPIMILCQKNYLIGTLVLAWVCYSGIWRVFSLFRSYFPHSERGLAFAFLFLPSSIFWASGISKDSVVLAAIFWFIVAIHGVFIQRQFLSIIYLLIAFYVIMYIRPYIIYALFPGLILWVFWNRIQKIPYMAMRILIGPFVLLITTVIAFLSFIFFGDMLLEFSVDNALQKAAVTQYDLKQEYYGGNSFDIGSFEPTIPGVAQKLPIALFSGLFRPFLGEGNGLVTRMASLETTLFFILFIWACIRTRVVRLIGFILKNPPMYFFVAYTFILAFIVGLTTSNFGALVRFKVAYISIFVSFLIVALDYKKYEEQDEYNVK